ncbi:MAG: DUF2829 domain-containing protein [Oscillospiraceae bacterium]|nr:DUF2829 domain-containing protein [Oscillospiraceae bacterium]
MRYSEVVPALESGKRIARRSWHLKGRFRKYLFLASFRFDMFPNAEPAIVLLMRLSEQQVQLWRADEKDKNADDWEVFDDVVKGVKECS